MKEEIKKIISFYNKNPENLISMLQEIQEMYGYISQEAVEVLAKNLHLPESKIYGVATFYTQFKFKSSGEHMIKVCLGTACHVKGGEEILTTLENTLGIKKGETTENGKFTLERVACVGCCALAPVVVIDEEVHGNMSPSKILKKVDELKKK